jgi:hypothetical protein
MRALLLATSAALLCSCAKTADTPAALVSTPPSAGSLPTLADPEAQNGHVGRAPRRITVAQLKASIQIAAGTPWVGLDTLAPSLGQADFALVNSESIDPNLVFAKFLDDGARQVCLTAATSDLAAPTPAARVLAQQLPANLSDLTTLSDAAVRGNLVYLSTRFWGEPLSGAELDAWTGFFKKAAARAQAINKREQALAATCVALMTDPRFFTY